MGYTLKSGLSKTMIHQVVSEFVSIELPPVRQCEFRRFRNTYNLSTHDVDGVYYEIHFRVWGGYARIYVSRFEYIPEDDRYFEQCLDGSAAVVPFEYLQEHGLLREVA